MYTISQNLHGLKLPFFIQIQGKKIGERSNKYCKYNNHIPESYPSLKPPHIVFPAFPAARITAAQSSGLPQQPPAFSLPLFLAFFP